MMRSHGPKDTKGQKQKRGLQRKVLAHLKRHGSSLYDALSVRFDPHHTAEVQPILRGLKEYGYIDVNRDKMVTLSSLGLEYLGSILDLEPATAPRKGALWESESLN